MGVGGVEPHQHPLLPVRPAIAIGIPRVPKIRRLHDQDAILIKLETGRRVQVLEERNAAIGAAVAVSVLENQEAVAVPGIGPAQRVVRPDRDPEPAAGIPGHLDGLGELGKLLLAGEKVEAGVEGHLGDRLLAAKEGERAVGIRSRLVGGDRRDGWQVRIVDHEIAALRHRPDTLIAVGGHDIALAHLLLHDLVVADLRRTLAAVERELRAAPVDIVAVRRAVARMPHRVLLIDGRPEPRVIARRRRPGEQRAIDHGGQFRVALLVQVNAIERQRPALARGGGEQLLGRREQIDERHAGPVRGDFGHGRGVERQVGVGLRRHGEIRIRVPLTGDRGKEHDARRPHPVVALGPGLAQELGEVLLEFRQPVRTLERLVETEEREDDPGLDPRQPLVRGAEIL